MTLHARISVYILYYTFSHIVRKNDVGVQVEFTLKIMERARVTCCLLVYLLKFFRILASRCGSVVVRERD